MSVKDTLQCQRVGEIPALNMRFGCANHVGTRVACFLHQLLVPRLDGIHTSAVGIVDDYDKIISSFHDRVATEELNELPIQSWRSPSSVPDIDRDRNPALSS